MHSPTLACVVIAGGNRTQLIEEQIIPSLAGFSEILIVGNFKDVPGVRYLHVPDMTQSTNDALVKRDVGTVACRADVITYLSDDHAVLEGFVDTLRALIAEILPWDVLVPSRWADHPELGRIRIPNGEENSYCAGHGGVFRRRVIMDCPWTAHRHHRNWDLIASHEQQQAGFRFLSYPALQIKDCEPERAPWA